MRVNLFSELANLLDILILRVFFCQPTIGFDQAPGEIDRAIAHQTLHVVQHRSYLLSGELGVIEEGNKGMNGLLEVDIILPKGIVCINHEMVVHSFCYLSCTRNYIFVRDWLFLVHPQAPLSRSLLGLTSSPQAILVPP